MAAPGGQFFIQSKLKTPAPHHENFKQLWETKWKKPAEMGVYPFMFGYVKDFEPIVDELVKNNMREPYDWDEYAKTFFPQAERLASIAEDAERRGEKSKASEFYLRASAIYRISRFPAPRSENQRYAWTKGKEVCLKGLQLRPHPIHEVYIPHTHALPSEGSSIPVYHQLPPFASPSTPAPLLIIITGLDGYRTELAVWAEGFRQNGIGVVIVEIPGTGDSPALPSDPTSPDRLFSSVLDWIDTQPAIDNKRICAWGFSTGGYNAIRLAHTHHSRLLGVVALGGGCHHMFSRAWLSHVNHLEYPFDLANTLAHKFGYGNDVEKFISEAQDKFSLLNDGTLDGPDCARLLLVNGTEDEVFPIDDYYEALMRGRPKEVRFVRGVKHMGEPESFSMILKWLHEVWGVKADIRKQLMGLRFSPKYPTGEEPGEEVVTNGVNGASEQRGSNGVEEVTDIRNLAGGNGGNGLKRTNGVKASHHMNGAEITPSSNDIA